MGLFSCTTEIEVADPVASYPRHDRADEDCESGQERGYVSGRKINAEHAKNNDERTSKRGEVSTLCKTVSVRHSS